MTGNKKKFPSSRPLMKHLLTLLELEGRGLPEQNLLLMMTKTMMAGHSQDQVENASKELLQRLMMKKILDPKHLLQKLHLLESQGGKAQVMVMSMRRRARIMKLLNPLKNFWVIQNQKGKAPKNGKRETVDLTLQMSLQSQKRIIRKRTVLKMTQKVLQHQISLKMSLRTQNKTVVMKIQIKMMALQIVLICQT